MKSSYHEMPIAAQHDKSKSFVFEYSEIIKTDMRREIDALSKRIDDHLNDHKTLTSNRLAIIAILISCLGIISNIIINIYF